MDVLRAQIATWVNERFPTTRDHTIRINVHDRQLYHPITPRWKQSGRLKVNDGISSHVAPSRL